MESYLLICPKLSKEAVVFEDAPITFYQLQNCILKKCTVALFPVVLAGAPGRRDLGGRREVAPAAADPGRLQVH